MQLTAPRSAPETRMAKPAEEPPPRRIGVLGGTFDPPHIGHLWLGTLAADALDLDRVLFMPAAQPPHKGDRLISRTTDRLLMTRLAIQRDPAFELSGLELERPGPSYTIDSVTELKRLHPDAELFLVMAADSLAQIDTWREPDRLLDEVEWIVGPRPGSELPDPSALDERFGDRAGRIHALQGPALDVSSSEIRRRVAAGHTIRYLVPRDVEEMIIDRELYRRG
jgi:nicotinate-nucleotide adenylyltransferase